MDRKGATRIVDIRELWDLFIRHLWLIVLVGLVVTAGVRVYSVYLVEPLYESKATLYILRRDNEPNYTYTQSDFSLAKDVVNDCTYVIKSQEVLDKVLGDLQLNMSFSQLSRNISTNNPSNTRFLEVSVKSESPEKSKKIADSICDISSDKIKESMGFEQVNIYAYGTLPTKQCNSIRLLRCCIIGLIAAVLVYAVYLILFLFDTKIRNEDDIKKFLDVSMLGEIPCSDENRRKRGRYEKYYTYRNRKMYQYSYKAKH